MGFPPTKRGRFYYDRLVYDNITKAVYWNDKAHGDDGHMTEYLGEHLRPCKYVNGRIVEKKGD